MKLSKSFFSRKAGEEGQGLVEYALILVLVSIAVITALSLVGDGIDSVFIQLGITLSGSSITDLSAERTGNGNGNDVVVSIAVARPVDVTVSDSQSGQSHSITCNNNCQVTLTGVGDDAGAVTVAADGRPLTIGYDSKG